VDIYYAKYNEDDQLTTMDLIHDDLASQDAGIEQPVIENYQHIEKETSFWGTTYDRTVTDDSYYDAVSEYNEKLSRDSIREQLQESSSYVSSGQSQTIYLYTPKTDESTEVVSGYIVNFAYGYQNPVFLYAELDTESLEQISFSRYLEMDYDERSEALSQVCEDAVGLYMVSGGSVTQLDVDLEEYGTDVTLNATVSAQDECYFSIYSYDSEDSTLFKTSISKPDGTATVVAEEFGSVEFTTDKGIYYTIELESGVGDLYFEGSKVDSDVESGSVKTWKDGAGILYTTDPDSNYAGTLKQYNGSKTVKIADDVADYLSGSSGNIVFLSDYNFTKGKGDLKLYKNGKITDVDDEVACILNY
jgi:hypothetical protein